MLLKLENIPIYKFNYKTTSKDKICYSPMAQDWNEEFKSDKDKLKIEVMDMLGVSLQCIKELTHKCKILENEVKNNKKKISELSKKINNIK